MSANPDSIRSGRLLISVRARTHHRIDAYAQVSPGAPGFADSQRLNVPKHVVERVAQGVRLLMPQVIVASGVASRTRDDALIRAWR